MWEGISYIDVIDIFRFLLTTILFEIIFVEQIESRKKHFKVRVLIGSFGVGVFGFLYLPFCIFQEEFLGTSVWVAFITWLWWLLADVVVFLFAYYCYEITVNNCLYYGIMALAVEEIHTVFLQYWICKKCLPDLMTEHIVLYLFLLFATTVFVAFLEYKIFAQKVKKQMRMMVQGTKETCGSYILILIFLSVMTSTTSAVFEWSNGNVEFGSIELFRYVAIPYYCILVNFITCIIIIILQVILYEASVREQEKNFLTMLQKEREWQYEFNRENIDLINAKCHDLKHQIKALASVNEEDRKRLFAETENAIDFYDAFVKTGNSVLDTILTEKSLICAKYKIRFSCNTRARHLDKVDVIDLYTILGNILDNAIECVRNYEDPEKKVISLSILEKGDMLNIFADNYFDGELKMEKGFPITSKKDKGYHGYGVKSIKMIAEKYDGDIRISCKNHTFSIQVMMKI